MHETALRHKQQLTEQRIRLSAVVQGQEEERRRLSRELHDGIGQMLTGAKLLSENVRSIDQLTPADQTTFGKLRTLLVRIIQETRHVSNNLMPPVLSDFGLLAALRLFAENQHEQTGIEVSFQTKLIDIRFNPAVEIGLYRIAQEAVNNATKHANASRISVSLNWRGEQLQLRVHDDGCGFQYAFPATIHSQGLHNMRERAKLLDGNFRLLTRLQAGTTVQVSVPTGVATRSVMHSIAAITQIT
jgi:signal transduction histidine kinase